MAPGARWTLQAVLQELRQLEARVHQTGEVFLEYLIASAADEAQDQLRDDRLLMQECDDRRRATSVTGFPLRVV